jgi:hypothetical protein
MPNASTRRTGSRAFMPRSLSWQTREAFCQLYDRGPGRRTKNDWKRLLGSAATKAIGYLTKPARRRANQVFVLGWPLTTRDERPRHRSLFHKPACRAVVAMIHPGCRHRHRSKPSSSTSRRTTALAAGSSPATGKAIRPGVPFGCPNSSRC